VRLACLRLLGLTRARRDGGLILGPGLGGLGRRDGPLVSLGNTRNLGVRVAEPVRRPQPVIPPAEALKVLTAQPIPVADAAGSPVGRPVGFDSENHPARIIRMGCGEVDTVTTDAVLRDHGDPGLGQPLPHVCLERIELGRA
jgi:hypothetical protein